MLKIFVLFLLIHTTAAQITSTVLYKEIFAYHNETEFKANFASQVVEKIYIAFRQWFFTIIFCEFTYSENRILKYTENMDYGYPVLLLNACPDSKKSKVKPKLNKHGETTYIVSSDELSLEVNEFVLEALLRTGVFKPRSVVIFVINTPVQVDSYFYFSMEQHFQLLWSRRITNSVLMVWSDKLRMYAYNPFYGKVREITYAPNVNNLLARQYYNLYGHELRLSVFRKIFVSDDIGPIQCNSRLTRTVIKELNATCLPLAPRDGSTVGDLLENGTATGVTGDLIEGYTDLELSSRILKNSYYGYIDTTYPLAQDSLCFIIKKSQRQSAFTTTIKLISKDILIIFMCNVVVFTILALLFRKAEIYIMSIEEKQSTGSMTMDIIKCFLRQTVDVKFLGPVFRIMVLMIIMYSLIVDCAIDGIITSAITYPRYKQDIDTLSELVKETNLTFAVHNRHFNVFNKSISDEYYTLIKDRIEIVNDKKIKSVIDKRQYQYAILMRKTDAAYLSQKVSNMKNGRPLYHVVKECPLPCFIVYGMQYGTPYLPRVNYILHHLNQGGILQHWTDAEQYSLSKSLGKILYADDSKERKALHFKNLQEIFLVWMVGLLLATIIVICEVVYDKFSHRLVLV